MQLEKKILSVEGIRGWACFIVFLSHLSLIFYPYLHAFNVEAEFGDYPIQQFIHESPFGFFFSGASAVFIFYVLSGYILTKVALKDNNVSERVYLMGLKRYPRLMIPALVSCLIAYLATALFDITSPQLSDWINGWGKNQSHSAIGAIYSGAIDVFLSGKSSYNPVLRTMKTELLGSFIVYLLCLNRAILKIPFLTGSTILITTALTLLRVLDPNLALGFISFYGGYLFSIYGRKISNKVALAFVIMGLYFAGAHNTSFSYTFIHFFLGDFTYKLCNFISAFFIVYAIIFNDGLNRLFSGRYSVFMGKVSFSVYVIHMPFLSTFGVLFFNALYKATGIYDLAAVISSVSSIFMVYFLSKYFYQSIDLKAMSISNSFAKYALGWLHAYSKTIQRTSS